MKAAEVAAARRHHQIQEECHAYDDTAPAARPRGARRHGGTRADGLCGHRRHQRPAPVKQTDVSTTIPSDPVTLTLAYSNDPPTQVLIDGFKKKHPNVTIKPQMTPFNDYVKSIKLAMSGDAAPDIAQYNPGAMNTLVPAGLDPRPEPVGQGVRLDGQVPAVHPGDPQLRQDGQAVRDRRPVRRARRPVRGRRLLQQVDGQGGAEATARVRGRAGRRSRTPAAPR